MPIHFDSRFKVRKWELEFEKRTGIELINPFYDRKRLDVLNIDAGKVKRYDVDASTIVDNDTGIIAEPDVTGIVAIIDGSLSYGTIQEMVYSKIINNKPVYSLITNGHDKHPWLMFHSTEVFTKLDQLESYLIGKYGRR